MKLVIASVSHETNSFSPIPTTLDCFGSGKGPLIGPAALNAFRNTGTPAGAFIQAAERLGAEIDVPIVARCSPSAPVDDHAFDVISDAIAEAVGKGCDAVVLDLHGAMITNAHDDGEGVLLERLRRLAPRTPIAVALDLHANISSQIIDHATLCVGYKTYPHVDMFETGVHVFELLMRAMRGEIAPVMAWGNAPMLPHTLCMDTNDEPMRSLIRAVKEIEARSGILAASLFGGFPLADTPQAGLSCIIVADGDRSAAEKAKDEILAAAWKVRDDFVYRAEPLAASIARARNIEEGPVLLIDHGDNCNSGGTLDSMSVVAEAMRQGLADVAVAPICDPDVAQMLHQKGVGADVSLDLGGRTAMPLVRQENTPLRISGRITALSDGQLTVTGPVFTGTSLNMGPSGVIDTGTMQIIVTSRRIEPYDLGIFRSLGIEPTQKRYLILKSRIQYKPTFVPISKAVIECNGTGACSSDYSHFDFRRVRRPIYPLDIDTRF